VAVRSQPLQPRKEVAKPEASVARPLPRGVKDLQTPDTGSSFQPWLGRRDQACPYARLAIARRRISCLFRLRHTSRNPTLVLWLFTYNPP
jgi:hypothetical protein